MDEPDHPPSPGVGGPRKTRRRFERPCDARYLTFSCFRRLPLLGNAAVADRFAVHLAAARRSCGFALIAWVAMPEHVHLLLWPALPAFPVPRVLHAVKRPLAVEAVARWRELGAPILDRLTTARGQVRFWQQGGGYDRNIVDGAELEEKVRYIHMNPVERGLCDRPEDWRWSSARWYAGDRGGAVPIDPVRRPVEGEAAEGV